MINNIFEIINNDILDMQIKKSNNNFIILTIIIIILLIILTCKRRLNI
jgi:hypothetical protein